MHQSFAALLGFGRVYQERTVILFPVHSHRCEDTPFPLRPPFGTRSSCDRPTHDSVMGGTNDVRPSFSPGCPLLGTRDLLDHSVDSSNDSFENYYKDISERMKNRELDLLIVVNMFLTGFDATTLNTLWVDKNLRYHGLIQAFSRTNRILNSVKSFGNIICFRKLRKATNDAIALFGDENATGTVLLKTYEEYYNGYIDDNGVKVVGYKDIVERLLREFPLGEEIIGEEDAKNFIKLFGSFLRLTNILSAFDTFEGNEILSERELQDYRSIYLDMYRDIKLVRKGNKENITPDIIFEIELVKQTEINIDYILFLVGQKTGDPAHDAELVVKIKKSIGATPDLRDKEDLIMQFVNSASAGSKINDDWAMYVRQKLSAELQDLITSENLKPEKTMEFLQQSFRDGEIRESGTGIAGILPPMPLFGAGGNREAKKLAVTEKLKALFKRFYDLCGGVFPALDVE